MEFSQSYKLLRSLKKQDGYMVLYLFYIWHLLSRRWMLKRFAKLYRKLNLSIAIIKII